MFETFPKFETNGTAGTVANVPEQKIMTSMSLVLDLIFPIRDLSSANLMMLKATCLRNAGIIDDQQWALVHERAERLLRRHASIPASVRDSKPCTTEDVILS